MKGVKFGSLHSYDTWGLLLSSKEIGSPEVKEKKVEIPEGFEEPWSEHKISWNEAKLRARGFIAARCKEQAGIKGYDLYREDSSNMFFTKEKLTMMGYVDKACATKVSETSATAAAAPVKATAEKATTATVADKATPVKLSEEPTKTFCAPWAEHNVAFNKDVLAAKGYCGAKTEMRGGIKGYVLFYTAGGERFLTVETLCMLKLANKVDVKAVSIAETTETAELDTGHVCVETVDEAVETTAVEEKKTEEPMYPLFLEDDGVEAYCMQKVCDNPAIKGLQEACANLAEERKQYTEQAIVCASRYYLQIKNSQEVLEGEELAAYEKTDKVYNAITAGEELFAYGKPFTDIEGILAEIEETKLEKTLVEKDVDALEEKAEGAFADLLKAIDEGFALKAKVEEIFNINIGLKEQAEEWIRENFGELLTDSAVESCIFNKEDCETWKNCVSGIISCEEKMRDKEKELSKALERQAEAYWKENAEEICEAIRDDEVENVSDETRNRWNLQAKEESEGGVPTDMEDEE